MDPEKQVCFHHNSSQSNVKLISLQHDIASKGGQASSGSFEPGSEKAREAGRKGGSK